MQKTEPSGSSCWKRRQFLSSLSLAGASVFVSKGCLPKGGVWVNDVHSRLTATKVGKVFKPSGHRELLAGLRQHLRYSGGVSVAGGRHSMGAQAFGTGSFHWDLTGICEIGDFDQASGVVEVAPGTTWPILMQALEERQARESFPWCIRQKQTGADHLTLGGALASNIHGRGLAFAPFVRDLESFTLLMAGGDEIQCSRTENQDWFALVVGGYGLFGVVTSLRLRLVRRQTVRRMVALERIERLSALVEKRIREGHLYGDFQFSTAAETEGFLREGVFSTYQPVKESLPEEGSGKGLSTERWKKLITLAHVDKAAAFRTYADYYLGTDGQLYASDRQQMSTYLPDYHDVVAEAVKPLVSQSLVITELYIPRERLLSLMDRVREDLRIHQVDLVYGVIRWIEPDTETFLPWACGRNACVIFNLNVRHDEAGRRKAAVDFRRLIDRALEQGGSYYLTYHRHATREQVEAAHPKFPEFLAEKEKRDPRNLWRSDWYRHYRTMFSA